MKHNAQLQSAIVRALFEKYRAAEFFWLYDSYHAYGLMDAGTGTTSLSYDGYTKAVEDYGGIQYVGMPPAVEDVEKQFYKIAKSQHWGSC